MSLIAERHTMENKTTGVHVPAFGLFGLFDMDFKIMAATSTDYV